MPETSRPITPDEFLLEALVRGGDVLTIAQRRFGWSVTQVLDWFDQPWVQLHLAGARELEDVRYDFTLARVRGKVTLRLAELSMAEGIAPETQRKAAEEVTRTIRARDRRARASAAPAAAAPSTPAPAATTTQPAPRQEHAPVKTASPPSPPPAPEVSEATVTPEVAAILVATKLHETVGQGSRPSIGRSPRQGLRCDDAMTGETPVPPQGTSHARSTAPPEIKTPPPPEVPEVSKIAEPPEAAAASAVAPAAAIRTCESADEPRGQDEAQAGVRGEPSIDRDVCATGEPRAGERAALAGTGAHGRGWNSGWKKPRTAAFDGAAFVGGADAGRGVTGGGRGGLREGPAQKSRPPPTPRR